MPGLTYRKAGVDIQKAQLFKQRLAGLLEKSYSPLVLKGVGGFGSLFSFPKAKYKEPVLVASADGVGTKLKIAQLVNKHTSVGVDLVAMNINDILCLGARPLFFLDYIACGKLDLQILCDLIKGINAGCRQAGCSLIGGETAQMPGMYKPHDYDLAGFCVGIVERKNIIDGSKVKAGDRAIGLASNGLHANGFSLVRKVFSKTQLFRMSAELLRPTRIYVKPILSLLQSSKNTEHIKGIAHITGGAFYDKISRILPKDMGVYIDKHSWPVPKIFHLIQHKGNIVEQEMYGTFNMGIGMVLVVAPKSTNQVIAQLSKFNLESWVIGEVVGGRKQVEII